MRPLVVCAASVATAFGCTADFDRFTVQSDAGPPPGVGGSGNAAAVDAASGADSGWTQGGTAGSGGGDAASDATDAGMAGMAGGAGLPACSTTYGGSPGYKSLCLESEDSCEIAFASAVQSCLSLCQSNGGICVTAYNISGTSCVHEDEIGCEDVGHSNALCICSRGCGNKPPCPVGQICSGATCS